ncbi:hypothetical protein Tco_0078083 [Tanacetum coccineum]
MKKPQNQKGEDQCCIPWTPKEETTLCKSWVRISEDSDVGNARKEKGFWVAVVKQMHATFLITKRRTYDMVNGKWKTMCPKVATFCEFMQDKEERMRKRYKSSDESSFNTRELGDDSFNLNSSAGDEEDKVQEVRRSHPIGRD